MPQQVRGSGSEAMRYRILLVPLLVAALATTARAGIIFSKKPKVVPEKRVPELLAIVKNDGDENKRYDAAAELRQYDPTQFPLIVPTLIEVLMTDKKASVRSEAAQSLSKLRPVSEQVVPALEHARDKDESLRVRMQARSSLLGLHWLGIRSDPGKLKQDGPAPPTTKEPPLAPPAIAPLPMTHEPMPRILGVPVARPIQPPEPILSPPPAPSIVTPPAPVINRAPGTLQPLPVGPPATPPAPVPVSPTGHDDKGPELGPQE